MTEDKQQMELILLRAIQTSLEDKKDRWIALLNALKPHSDKNAELRTRLKELLESLIAKGYITIDDKVELTPWDGNVPAASDNARKLVEAITAITEKGAAFLNEVTP